MRALMALRMANGKQQVATVALPCSSFRDVAKPTLEHPQICIAARCAGKLCPAGALV